MKNKWRVILGFRVKVGSPLYKWLIKNKARLLGWVKKKKHKPAPKPPPKPTQMFMFDDVNVTLIPENAEAVAGYVDGKWVTWGWVLKNRPKAKRLSIAVFAKDTADCLDVEPGDASISEAANWLLRAHATWAGRKHDVRLPTVYTQASHGQALVDALSKAGLKYGVHYLWWSAHYDPAFGKHLCGPRCGFGIKQMAHATQFTDHAGGKNLDESVCAPGFFG